MAWIAGLFISFSTLPCLPTLTSFHINMVVPTKKAMNQRLASWTLVVGLFVVSCVAELERFEHAGKPDGSLSFLVVGDWGRRGHYNQSQVAFQVFCFSTFLKVVIECSMKTQVTFSSFFLVVIKKKIILVRSFFGIPSSLILKFYIQQNYLVKPNRIK